MKNSFRHIKKYLLDITSAADLCLIRIFSTLGWLSSVYYLLFNRGFDREHKAVLTGRYAYLNELRNKGSSSVMLRRNIHRIEKGLIMQPRRDYFAEDYIDETVKCFQNAIHDNLVDEDEKKWSRDVLAEYFSAVRETKKISKAKILFEKSLSSGIDNSEKKYIPYLFENLPQSEINYDDLHKLYLRRRSVRWYKSNDVPIELIEKAINIAALAPSACNRQPYYFYVSSCKEKAIAMAKCAGGTRGFAENLPCVIAVIGDLSSYPFERDRHVVYIDGSLAAMQLMLGLETLGLSSCPINWPDVDKSEIKLKELLDLKTYERPIMLIAVGFAQDKGGIPYSQKKTSGTLLRLVK